MRLHVSTAFLLLLTATAGCLETAPDRCLPDADGLLNPDFECALDAENAIRGWSLLPDYAEGATLGLAADPEGGSVTARLTSNDPGWHGAGQAIEASNLVGHVLRLSGRVRLEGDQVTAGISLYLEGKQDTVFFLARTLDELEPGAWHDVETFALPFDQRADHLRLVLWIEGQGQAWFDDLAVTQSRRDRLGDFDRTCEQQYDCDTSTEICRLGRCLPQVVAAGELAAPEESIRMQAFQSIWNHADAAAPGFVAQPALDWDEAYEKYSKQVKQAGTWADFGGALTRLIAEFRDSHGHLYISGVNSSSMHAVVFGSDADIACTTRTLDDRIAVYRVVEGNPLGLEIGDEILGFDGRDWQDLDAEIWDSWDTLALAGSATPNETTRRWAFASSILYNRFYFHETVEVRRAADGRIESLPLADAQNPEGERISCFDRPIFTLPAEFESGGGFWRNPVVSGLIENERIIYAAVRSMSGKARTETEALLQDHPDTAGLIWDVRLNGGGINEAGAPIWEALMDEGEEIHTSNLLKRAVIGETGRNNMDPYVGEWIRGRGDRHYSGKVAILTGPKSVSAADTIPWMAAHLSGDRVRRFGLATNGSFSGYFMSEGSSTSIPVDAGPYSEYFSYVLPNFVMSDAADDRILLGTDQHPEELVWLTPEGLAAGRDDVVDAAVAWILGTD